MGNDITHERLWGIKNFCPLSCASKTLRAADNFCARWSPSMLISGGGGMAGKRREHNPPLRRIERACEWLKLAAVLSTPLPLIQLLLLLPSLLLAHVPTLSLACP